jgi:signal transduction histidine kinase
MPIGQRPRTAEERLARLIEVQALLGRVSREIGSAGDLDSVLATVMQAMRSLVEFKGGTIQLVDDGGVYVAAADPPVSEDVKLARVPVGSGLSGRVISNGRTVYSPDLLLDDRVDPKLRRLGSNAATRSYVAVPLIVAGTVIGALQVDSVEVAAFDEDDVALLEGLATQVSGAIESARRHEQVMELERMKGDFIARISHELRTPLTIMGGFTDTLLLHGKRLSPDQHREVLERIRGSIGRLSTLIEELLTVSSLEAGVTRARPEETDLAELLDQVRENSIDPSRVSVSCEPALRTRTDPRILRHAVGLLVDNALKYAGDAELSAEVSPDRRLVVRVRDHGPGIPAQLRDRVFERFFRGEHTGAGMGLGLPVVRQLAGALGLVVELDDAPGGGASFTLRTAAAA